MLKFKTRVLSLICLLTVGAAVALYSATSRSPERDSIVETRSPQGTYTVLFERRKGAANALGFFPEFVKLTVTRNHDLFFVKDPFFGGGKLELHFKGAYPVIEWVNDFSLRMGGDLASQPFRDEINLINKTEEKLDVVEIFYGRYERFLIFDLEPQATLTLLASPQFSVNQPPAANVIYEATSLSTGHKRSNIIENVQRKSASDGPLKTAVEIR